MTDWLLESRIWSSFFADDSGYADFGFQEHARSDFKNLTPHIDSIAKAGARFHQRLRHSRSLLPSRAGMMTGRYQERFGHETNLPPGTQSGLPLDETFGVKRLQEIGYKTGLIGKSSRLSESFTTQTGEDTMSSSVCSRDHEAIIPEKDHQRSRDSEQRNAHRRIRLRD